MTPQTEKIIGQSLYDKEKAPYSPFGKFMDEQLAIFTASEDDNVLDASILHMLGDIGTVLGELLARAPNPEMVANWFCDTIQRTVAAGGIDGLLELAESTQRPH